jgi:hypothetical protein
MKRIVFILTLSTAVLIGFLLAFGSEILQNGASSSAQSSSFIQPLTAPNASAFTQVNFNTGSGVVTTQVNNSSPVTSITLNQSDPNATLNIAALDKSPINSAFTITLGFTVSPGGSACAGLGACVAGLWLYDGSSNNLCFCFESVNWPSTVIQVYSNLQGAFVTNVYAQNLGQVGPLIWERIQETASARNYSISSDGINFFQIATESNTAHFTTAKYGFMAEGRNTSSPAPQFSLMTVYSFTETTP